MGISNRVQAMRTERRWTQADLAHRVGVSRQTINSIETGRFEPSLGLALKLARLFEERVETLFLLDGEGGGTSTAVPAS